MNEKTEKIEVTKNVEEALTFTMVMKDKDSTSETNKSITIPQGYELGDVLGKGGMGLIQEANDVSFGRSIAMKSLLKSSDIAMRDQFVEEAQITAQLEHPNVPPIYAIGQTEHGNVFLAMKKLEGNDLSHLIEKNKILTEQEIYTFIDALIKVSNALSFAHSRGVIHRDLKPENIWIEKDGGALLLDWGIAKYTGKTENNAIDDDPIFSDRSENKLNLTMEGTIKGTPGYMAPEQARGEMDKIDARTDIFAIGATLYECLTGYKPIDTPNISMALLNTAAAKILPMPKYLPTELKAICLKALSQEQSNRYQSIKEFANDLKLYRDGFSVSAKKDSVPQQLYKIYKRNPLLIKVYAAFSSVLFSTIAVAIWAGIQAETQLEILEEKTKVKNIALKKEAVAITTFKETTETEKRDNAAAIPALETQIKIDLKNWNVTQALKNVDLLLSASENSPKHIELKNNILLTQKQHSDYEKSSLFNKFANQPALAQFFATKTQLVDGYNKILKTKKLPLVKIDRKTNLISWELVRQKKKKNKLKVDNIDFMAGWKLDSLKIPTNISDISALKGMPLQYLNISNSNVVDLSPLENMSINTLIISRCKNLTDLTPLLSMSIKNLNIEGLDVNENMVKKLILNKNLTLITLNAQVHLDHKKMFEDNKFVVSDKPTRKKGKNLKNPKKKRKVNNNKVYGSVTLERKP